MMDSNNGVRSFSFFLLILFSSILCCSAYNYKDPVKVEVNTVGPFHNPAESYKYYSLPYCIPKEDVSVEDDNLSEVLAGDRRRNSLYDIRFGIKEVWRSICHFQLSELEIKQFRQAIKQHYIFEIFVDDLPVKGFVGEVEVESKRVSADHTHQTEHIYLFTHLEFSIAKNGGNIIAVNLTTDVRERVELNYEQAVTVQFSYSVKWIDTDVNYVDRQFFHSRSAIGEQAVEIHWLSIINTFVLVILLTAFLGVILVRVLRKDFARYMELDEENSEASEEEQEESGWKLVHADVFRFPKNVMLLTAALGNGCQILVLVTSLLALALLGTFYPGNRGALYLSAVLLYVASSFIAGYVSTSVYLQLNGQKWATNSLLAASLFAGPFFITFSIVNSIAWYYGSSSALPAVTIILIIAMWALISFPLTIFGSMRARHSNLGKLFDAPCKTNRVERQIPPTPWYRHPILHWFIAGFLPFSAIYIELHYIFAAVWGQRVYTLFGILSLAFIMLITVTAFITIALTYFQLAAENYHWWWRAFLSGCSVGAFMYSYAIFYYHYRSEMYGVLQAAFFFGYVAMISYAFSLMLGTVSYFCAQTFVKHIYRSIKID
jgi:MFS family permease